MSADDSFSSDSSHAVADEVPADVEQARAQWAGLEQQQAAMAQIPTETGVGNVTVDRGYAITCFDARHYLVDQTSSVDAVPPPLADGPPRCFCFRTRNHEVHINAWNTIFKLSKLNFEESDLTHHRILNSLHALITGCKAPPLRRGDHWQTIGFQSDDPIRDLRAAGMLGLLLPFHLFAKVEHLGQKLVRTARLPEHEFPMMVVLINFVMTAIETAGTTQLLKSGNDLNSCWEELASFFAGIVEALCNEWARDLCDYQHDFQRFQQIAARARASPVQTVRTGKRAIASAPDAPKGGLSQDS
jgi:hypothetical protein